MPPSRTVDVAVKVVQLDGNTRVIQTYCKTHLRYEAEYGLKRGSCTNCYLLIDGDDALLIDVPRREYMAVFCAPPRRSSCSCLRLPPCPGPCF